jgi:hypothetical protein
MLTAPKADNDTFVYQHTVKLSVENTTHPVATSTPTNIAPSLQDPISQLQHDVLKAANSRVLNIEEHRVST